jgi:hypothetical protein
VFALLTVSAARAGSDTRADSSPSWLPGAEASGDDLLAHARPGDAASPRSAAARLLALAVVAAALGLWTVRRRALAAEVIAGEPRPSWSSGRSSRAPPAKRTSLA